MSNDDFRRVHIRQQNEVRTHISIAEAIRQPALACQLEGTRNVFRTRSLFGVWKMEMGAA